MRIEKATPQRRTHERVIETGHMEVTNMDAYCVTVTCQGRSPKGDLEFYDITITRNELAVILAAASREA